MPYGECYTESTVSFASIGWPLALTFAHPVSLIVPLEHG